MYFLRILVLILFAVLLMTACERPSSPDFTFQHTIQVPIISNRTIEFLGGANALIDTTTADFEDLFSIDDDGMVRVVTEVDFNIGDFDDMFPAMEVSPTDVEAQIGNIEVAFTGKGSTSFESITGIPASSAPVPGSPIMAGLSPEIDIALDVSDFERGVIESGGISTRFTNQLGFDINELNATLFSNGVPISGPEQLTDITTGDQKTITFMFQSQDEIDIPLIIRIQVEWDTQNVTSEPDELYVNAFDDELLAQNVTAVIRSQDFFSVGTIEIDDDEFRFTETSHYVEINQGVISINQIVNRIDLDIDTLLISFPDLLMPPFNDRDSLIIQLTGNDRIRRMESRYTTTDTDLNGFRIKALDNKIRYNLKGITENTRFHIPADSFRTIDALDYVEAGIIMSDLVLNEVFGIVQPRNFLLNNDEGDDTRLDLFNDMEAEITSLKDLEFISTRVNNLIIHNPHLNLLYRTNIGVPSRIFAAILGINSEGEEIYLRSSDLDPVYKWTIADTIQGFTLRGNDIPREYLIAFDVEPSPDPHGDPVAGVITFDKNNSNIGDFISNLPVEIRFIGKSVANANRDEGLVVDPVLFETSLDLDIPLNIGTDAVGNYKDTLGADLGFLPDEFSDTRVMNAALNILYENRLPLELGIGMEFLDEWGDVISFYPVTEDQNQLLQLKAAPIDGLTRFTNSVSSGQLQLMLDEEQLETLYRTKNIRLTGDFQTAVKDASSEVKIRFDDYFKFGLGIDVTINTRVN